MTTRLARGDLAWILTVVMCSLFVAAIMLVWSRLRGY
jgi:hypothetical protein